MNIKKLIEGASRNLLAKVICFVCALFIYIFHQVSLLDKKTFVVPLELVCEGLVAPTTAVPGYVKVSVRAQTEAMPSITAASVKASIDVSRYTEAGSYVVPVALEFSDSLLLVDPLEVTVKPESIKLTLGGREERYIPVMAALSGEPKHGYQVKNVSVSPSTVKAVGPEEILRRTKFIYTGKVNVSGAAANFASEVKLDNINSLVDVVPESEFKVTVEIAPAPVGAGVLSG
ncbi:MAG: hypothetical protein K2H09_08890, partial [Treponemataceae bacterium]|nr:hypothetical protein [Treponemataceae bacterium]